MTTVVQNLLCELFLRCVISFALRMQIDSVLQCQCQCKKRCAHALKCSAHALECVVSGRLSAARNNGPFVNKSCPVTSYKYLQ